MSEVIAKLVSDIQAGYLENKENTLSIWKELRNNIDNIIRPKFISDGTIKPLIGKFNSIDVCAVDGAYVVDSNVLHTECRSLAVCIDYKENVDSYSSIFFTRHLIEIGDIVAGLMTMQEIILAVKESKEKLVLVDGGRLGAIINLRKLYNSLEVPEIRKMWEVWKNENKDPGMIINEFEQKGLFVEYLTSKNIIGISKLVTTRKIADKVFEGIDDALCPKWVNKLDDKIIANLLLNKGEYFEGAYEQSDFVSSLSWEYPFNKDVEDLGLFRNEQYKINYCFLKLKNNDNCIKLEYNNNFKKEIKLENIVNWLEDGMCAQDLLEPYLNWAVDKICKEVMSIHSSVAENMFIYNTDDNELTNILMKGYRT